MQKQEINTDTHTYSTSLNKLIFRNNCLKSSLLLFQDLEKHFPKYTACGLCLVVQMNVGGAGLNTVSINSYVFVLMYIIKKLKYISSPVFHGYKC